MSTTPKVQYAYADGTANTNRPTTLTYPDGRVVTYDYGTSGSDDDYLSRIAAIKEGSASRATYVYCGVGLTCKTTYVEPAAVFDLTYQGNSTDPYAGCLDRFGRMIQAPWIKSAAPLAGATYQYDRSSNRTQMQPLGYTATNNLERYSYDGLRRLTRSIRGSMTTLKSQEAWELDPTGNWHRYDVSDVDVPARNLAQRRTANRTNEITSIAELYGSAWPTPTYDRVSNLVSFSPPADITTAETSVYDAWNRQVELSTGLSYAYDGLMRRIIQTTGGVERHSYYSDEWQLLEERTGSNPASSSPDRQFVWGIRYVDDLILRDRTTTLPLDERLYAFQDANWNVVAVSNATGAVVERYRYTAYGTPTFLNPSLVSTLTWN